MTTAEILEEYRKQEKAAAAETKKAKDRSKKELQASEGRLQELEAQLSETRAFIETAKEDWKKLWKSRLEELRSEIETKASLKEKFLTQTMGANQLKAALLKIDSEKERTLARLTRELQDLSGVIRKKSVEALETEAELLKCRDNICYLRKEPLSKLRAEYLAKIRTIEQELTLATDFQAPQRIREIELQLLQIEKEDVVYGKSWFDLSPEDLLLLCLDPFVPLDCHSALFKKYEEMLENGETQVDFVSLSGKYTGPPGPRGFSFQYYRKNKTEIGELNAQ